MAGWSLLSDGPALDCQEILHNLQNNGFCLDLNAPPKESPDPSDDKLRSLFDKILTIFLKVKSQNHEIKPQPAMLGDGRSVDLFNLYQIVRGKGGYDLVAENGCWGLVAEESGLGFEVGSCLKLLYLKYLNPFDLWLPRIFKEKGILGSLLSIELEKEIKGLLFDVSKKGCDDDDDDDEVIILDQSFAGVDFSSLKRKRERETLLGMLDWVMKIARNPRDTAIGKRLEGFRWERGEEYYFAQALIAREVLLVKKNDCLSLEGSLLQKRQKMDPIMCEDYVGSDLATEKLTCSLRTLSPHKRSNSCSCLETSTINNNDLDQCPHLYVPALENDPEKLVLGTVESLSAENIVDLFCEDRFRKRVPVGSLYQAEVPDWTGPVSESSYESKWLGTLHWPPKVKDFKVLTEDNAIGKGRPHSCGCELRGSVECVRFHVAEKRLRLKQELGSAFSSWRFNHMGEEVSLSWTGDEELRFKAMVRLNPKSLHNNFWDKAYISFPSKRRQALVSYYFNAYLLRCRSYQNRVTPNSIDSDNDESEFGFVSNSYGHDAVKVSGSKSILCTQNKQCVDLDDYTDMD
ncbi:AT-rich interactive domain-containing protein 2-like [Tasmannia lanceolata]|uniref:AT-rich interactive domain-containing protein 2-like n=1 Tax=Tasmannia lanceolata TaxID=3420 RepID=UPI0040641D0F